MARGITEAGEDGTRPNYSHPSTCQAADKSKYWNGNQAARTQAVGKSLPTPNLAPRTPHARLALGSVPTQAQQREDMVAQKRGNLRTQKIREVEKLFSCLPMGGSSTSSPPDMNGMIDLVTDMDETVGLLPVKVYIRRQINEALRFFTMGKTLLQRHLFLVGTLGTGKNTAVRLIQKAMKAVGLREAKVVNLDNIRERGALSEEVDKLLHGLDNSFFLFTSRDGRKIADARAAMSLQKREPETIQLQPYNPLQLAAITLQMIAGKVIISPQITVELVAKAIEHRWCEGERFNRSVYLAKDMAEYLTKEVTLGQAFAKGSASAKTVDWFTQSTEDMLPTAVTALLNDSSFNTTSSVASSLDLGHLGVRRRKRPAKPAGCRLGFLRLSVAPVG